MSDKKKYYMRGLGFGILITALILMAVHYNDRMTDERAIKRAKELGYVLEKEPELLTTQTIDMNAIKAKLTETPAPAEEPEAEEE